VGRKSGCGERLGLAFLFYHCKAFGFVSLRPSEIERKMASLLIPDRIMDGQNQKKNGRKQDDGAFTLAAGFVLHDSVLP
jgi:hypothetical protein